MIDFQQVKKDHSIMDVAERLGLKLKKDGAAFRGACPSGAEGDRKFVITPTKSCWYSFAAQKGGDVISLVAFVQGCSLKEAAQWIVGGNEPEKKQSQSAEQRERSAKTEAAEKPSEGFQPLPYLVADHEAVAAIGFPTDFATELGIGYAPRGVMRGYVALPVRDCNGRLRGYVGIQEAKLPSSWHP